MNKEEINSEWQVALRDYLQTDSFLALAEFVRQEYLSKEVYPPLENLFKALTLTPFSQVKVIILGQDPYHGPGQAQGLSFSVPAGVPLPPSLRNIYQELLADCCPDKHLDWSLSSGDLSAWAEQGVLLLNAILSVVAQQPASHRGQGWEEFTDMVIKTLSNEHEHLVFLLWGNYARGKKGLIDETKHLILEAPHPSPLSAYQGFFGSRHFSACNQQLRQWGQSEIDWLRVFK